MASIGRFLKNFYNQEVTYQDKHLLGLMGVIVVLGCLFWALNGLCFHYSGLSFLPWSWIAASPIILALWALARLVKTASPRVSLYTNTYATYYFASIALGVMCNGMQYTPFPLFDSALLHADQGLGFHQLALVNWTNTHHHVYLTAVFFYDALVFELMLLPPLFSLTGDRRAIDGFFVATLITYVLGMLIYYCLPTIGPVDVLSSPNFTSGQNQIYLRFFEVHHFLTVHENVGLIAFPSFHVIWAVLLTYMLRRHRWLFYPALCLNAAAVITTVMLGWHYLMDVFAGLAIAGLAIAITHWLNKRTSASHSLAHIPGNVVSLHEYRHNSTHTQDNQVNS